MVHPGTSKGYDTNIYGVDESFLDSVASEYYNPADYPKDLLNIGKNYGPNDILKALADANDYSQTEDPWDSLNIITNNPNKQTIISSNVYNLVVAEGLRGSLFSKISDDIRICVTSKSMERDQIIDQNDCNTKIRARVLGSLYKFPGLSYFTGYKFAEFIKSDSFLSINQYKDMINELL